MISIIIPTRNEEKIIGVTLLAFKNKLTLPHEIIVTDGASTDKTVEIAKTLADKVVEHKSSNRQTIAEGRNAGAGAATGEFLVFMDADCSLVDPDEFFKIALLDFKDERLVALTGWIRVFPDQETFADKVIFNAQNFWMMFLNNVIHTGVSPGGEFQMMRADVFRKIGGFNANLVAAEDIELFGRLGKEGRIRLDRRLKVFHTGRRGHKIGWPKLLSLWFLNTVWMLLFKKAYVKEWKVIR
jgi:glycosyltransferase involved in cell wall biosynthesis